MTYWWRRIVCRNSEKEQKEKNRYSSDARRVRRFPRARIASRCTWLDNLDVWAVATSFGKVFPYLAVEHIVWWWFELVVLVLIVSVGLSLSLGRDFSQMLACRWTSSIKHVFFFAADATAFLKWFWMFAEARTTSSFTNRGLPVQRSWGRCSGRPLVSSGRPRRVALPRAGECCWHRVHFVCDAFVVWRRKANAIISAVWNRIVKHESTNAGKRVSQVRAVVLLNVRARSRRFTRYENVGGPHSSSAVFSYVRRAYEQTRAYVIIQS